jgi:hypothetical protein
MTAPEALDRVAECQKNADAQDDIAAVKEGMFLELLVAVRVLAVTLRGIDYPAAGDTLSLVGKTEHPAKADDCGQHDDSGQNAHSAPSSRSGIGPVTATTSAVTGQKW